MSIQRVPPVPFTQIANSALRDKRLSFKARGVLALVLSNVGEWNATLAWLTSQSESDGRASVQAALNELTELGYRTVTKESYGDADIRTVVTWRHEPESAITRPMSNSTVEKHDGQKTGASLEEHLSEHHLTEQQTDKPLVPATPPREDVEHLCELLVQRITENGSRPPTITKAWRDAARLMLDKDKIPFDHIKGAIEWSQADEFWRGNILSMPTLRKQYDRLRLKAQQNPKRDNMQAHIALVQELWENEGTEHPRLEGL